MLIILAITTGLTVASAAAPEDWSRFRGPNGSGPSDTTAAIGIC